MKEDRVKQEGGSRELVERLKIIYRRYGIFLIFILMFIISSCISPNFLKLDNLMNVVRQNSAITILACGMTILIISGMIDLSGGATLTLAGCVAAGVMAGTNILLLAILAGVVVGSVTGWFNGFLITRYNLQPFIATLAMSNIANGLLQIYTNGSPIMGIGSMAELGRGYLGFMPIPIIIMIIFVLLTWVFLRCTKTGQYVYAIGGNEKAATASGINMKKMKRVFFTIHGFLAGIAGIVLMGRLNSGQPSIVSAGYEFDAIVAVIVGGTSFNGGIGSVLGTVIGAFIVGMINNVLLLLNVPTMYQMVVKGVLIAGAVIIDIKTRSSAEK